MFPSRLVRSAIISNKAICDTETTVSVESLFEFYRETPQFHFQGTVSTRKCFPYQVFALQKDVLAATCVSMHQLCVQWVFFAELHRKLSKSVTKSTGPVTFTGCEALRWRQISRRLGFAPADFLNETTENDCFTYFLQRIPEIHIDRSGSEVKYTVDYPSLLEKYDWMNTHTFWNRIQPLTVETEVRRHISSQPSIPQDRQLTSREVGTAIDLLQSKGSEVSLSASMRDVSAVLSVCRDALRAGMPLPIDSKKAATLCRYLVYLYNSLGWNRKSLPVRRKIKSYIALTQSFQNFIDPKEGSTSISTCEDKLVFSSDEESKAENTRMQAEMLGNKETRPFPRIPQ